MKGPAYTGPFNFRNPSRWEAFDGHGTALLRASPPAGRSVESAASSLAATGARVLEGELPVAAATTRFDEEGRLADEEIRRRLAEVVEELVETALERAGTTTGASSQAA
jgi:hypothetical protein